MFKKLTSAISSLNVSRESSPPTGPDHYNSGRSRQYAKLAKELAQVGVPVSHSPVTESPVKDDCNSCSAREICSSHGSNGTGTIVEMGLPWNVDGKSYQEYVEETYGDLGELPPSVDTDWESDLAGSAKGGRGRVVVVSTGKSDWERDHTDEKDLLSHHLHNIISKLPEPKSELAPTESKSLPYISSSAFSLSSLSTSPSNPKFPVNPSLYSSSLISQSTDPSDETVLLFPDWKVINEVENSPEGAKGLFDAALDGKVGRSGRCDLGDEDGVGRRRSWVLPYRAVILLCSHKRRDKRCHIAAPLLRSALHTVLSKHHISIDETGQSLSIFDEPAIEDLKVTSDGEREKIIADQIASIEGVGGGDGGEVGIFNINHLGGHRYTGVMLILFPSGAYLSYGRVTPQEIPRIVEETILRGKVIPGLLRNAVGVTRSSETKQCKGSGILGW